MLLHFQESDDMADDVPLVVSESTSNPVHVNTRSITPLLPLLCVALTCLAKASLAAYCLDISCGQSVCVQGGPGSVGTVLAAVQVFVPLPLPSPCPSPLSLFLFLSLSLSLFLSLSLSYAFHQSSRQLLLYSRPPTYAHSKAYHRFS